MDRKANSEYLAGNYDTALELYEDLLRENPASREFVLGKAKSLALMGRVGDAYNCYKRAKSNVEITEEHIGPFVDGLVKRLTDFHARNKQSTFETKSRILSCVRCCGILLGPCTLPCGHTVCEKCLSKLQAKKCVDCGEDYSSFDLRVNVILQDTLKKNFASELESARLRICGNLLLNNDEFSKDEILEKYKEAEKLNPRDHLLQSNMSHVLLSLGKFQEALDKAEQACHIRPNWPKGYYRKGCAFLGLGRNVEAAVSFVQCLALDPHNTAVKKSAVQTVHRIFEAEASTWSQGKTSTEHLVEAESQEQREFSLGNPETLSGVINQVDKEADAVSVDDGEPSEKKPRQESAMEMTVEEFECTLCCRLFYNPVTTPCGHVFCRACLNRSLDHRPGCPICRSSLTQFLAARKENVTVAIEMLLKTFFPKDYEDRKLQHEEDMAMLASIASNTSEEIPVFVCTLAFPLIPCPLHIFEPRYRLMVRQCMESGARQFGMCMYDDEHDFSEFGTMLEVREVRYLPDGRSFVDTVGGRRFKVLSRGMRDGYSVARVEWIQDVPVSEEHLPDLKEFHRAVYDQASRWFNSLPLLVRRRIVQTVSDMPAWQNDTETLPHGAGWLWWMVTVCPLDPKTQLRLLGMTSLRERLQVLQRVIALVSF